MLMSYLRLPHLTATDSQPLEQTRLDDLDFGRIEAHMHEAIRRGRYEEQPDPLQYLLLRHGAVRVPDQRDPIPTLAGMLLFGRALHQVIPYATVDIGHFLGTMALSTEVVHIEKQMGGTLPEQIDKAERYIWTNTHHGFRLGDGAQRIEEHEYPRSVIRELTVNALAHRDYTIGHVTRISLFRDRVEWDSPGHLPEGVTVETIRQMQKPRNPALLLLLYDAGYVEAFGMGWDTVFQTLHDEELPDPRLQETATSFVVTVYGRPRGGFTESLPMDLTEPQVQIYELIVNRGSMTRGELEAAVGERSLRSLQRDLQFLVERGLVITSGATRSLRYHPADLKVK
jgi:predicted HTH transcriptional regulator